MVGTGTPNISNIQYTERSIFVSLENTFIPKYSWTISFSFYAEYSEKK